MAWGACHDVSKCDCWIPQMREDGAEYSPELKVSRMGFFYFIFFTWFLMNISWYAVKKNNQLLTPWEAGILPQGNRMSTNLHQVNPHRLWLVPCASLGSLLVCYLLEK